MSYSNVYKLLILGIYKQYAISKSGPNRDELHHVFIPHGTHMTVCVQLDNKMQA